MLRYIITFYQRVEDPLEFGWADDGGYRKISRKEFLERMKDYYGIGRNIVREYERLCRKSLGTPLKGMSIVFHDELYKSNMPRTSD